MTIGVDIDDVIAQFNVPYLSYINSRFNTGLKFEDIKIYDYRLSFPEYTSQIDFFNSVFEFYQTEEFVDLPRVEDSENSIKRTFKKT